MPQIIVVADARDREVMFTERVTVSDFESPHFQNQLVERLNWAVGDADAAERSRPGSAGPAPRPARPRARVRRQPVSDAQPAS